MGMSAGLFLGALLETFKWTDRLAILAMPLARLAHLKAPCAASFSLAFVSPHAANGILAENYDSGKISGRELIVANLFNSLPAFLVHLPSVFLLLWPVLGFAAFIYAAISMLAAFFRLFASILIGRFILAPPAGSGKKLDEERRSSAPRNPLRKALDRFLNRLPKLIGFTVPFYFLILFLGQWGAFEYMERFLADRLYLGDLVNPRTISIIALQLLAEMGATLGAAAALLDTAGVGADDIVLAMLIGSALAAPIRAIRHQLPAYAGFFSPRLALRVVAANQTLRLASMIIAIGVFVIAR